MKKFLAILLALLALVLVTFGILAITGVIIDTDNPMVWVEGGLRTDPTHGLVLVSPFGRRIGSQYGCHLNTPSYRSDVLTGFPGRLNSMGEVRAVLTTENQPAYTRLLELGGLQNPLGALEALAGLQKKNDDFLAVFNTCREVITDQDRRALEALDGLTNQEYQSLPAVNGRGWVGIIEEVTEAEYAAADTSFNGWTPTAVPDGIYRHPYATLNGRFFAFRVMPYWMDGNAIQESGTSATVMVVLHFNPKAGPEGVAGIGVRHDDGAIIIWLPCEGAATPTQAPTRRPLTTPVATPTPSPSPSPTPTLATKPPRPEHYVQSTGIVPDPLPTAEIPNPEPTAAPTVAPTTAPSYTAAPTLEPPVPGEYNPPPLEPGLNPAPNGAGIDPFGGG